MILKWAILKDNFKTITNNTRAIPMNYFNKTYI